MLPDNQFKDRSSLPNCPDKIHTILTPFSGDEAFVSLTTNDDYACGAIVLGLSLKRTQTQRKLVLLVTEGVSGDKRFENLMINVSC